MLQRVTLRNQELSQRLAAASSEKAELLVELEASREDVQRFEEALQHNARKVGELTAQLSDSLGAQQALAKDEARLRAELSRAQIQLAQRSRD
jgi:regulator of replication initiation timing